MISITTNLVTEAGSVTFPDILHHPPRNPLVDDLHHSLRPASPFMHFNHFPSSHPAYTTNLPTPTPRKKWLFSAPLKKKQGLSKILEYITESTPAETMTKQSPHRITNEPDSAPAGAAQRARGVKRKHVCLRPMASGNLGQ